MRIAYFDCVAGISGGMTLGALIDAGADFDGLAETLGGLAIEPFSLECDQVDARGVRATKILVRASSGGVIRTYASIRALLDAADLPGEARTTSQRIFRRLAEAEAKVRRKEVDLVTFHEFGEVDSIVEITGTALALSSLGVERVFASPVPTGLGMARTEHGAVPIPSPTVVELLRGAPLYSRGVPFELVTPTGAAILAAVAEGYGDAPLMRLDSVGYGAGSERPDFPHVLRVLVGEEQARGPTPTRDSLVRSGTRGGEVTFHTNVPELEPEEYEEVLERAYRAGAREAWITPFVARGGRPGGTVTIVCPGEVADLVRRALSGEPPPPEPSRGPDLRLVPDEPGEAEP